MAKPRDDFSEKTKKILAQRVNYHCSNPDCGASTSGPNHEPNGVMNVGVASHITAAAPGGPRFNPNITPQERGSIVNGIWLCQTCAKKIDDDQIQFSPEILRNWKENAERNAGTQIGKPLASQNAEQIIDKLVNRNYPKDLRITQQLNSEGYKVKWVRRNEENTMVDSQGWEYVLINEGNGMKARLKIQDHLLVTGGYLVFLKKKEN